MAIKVKQDMIDFIKSQGMTKALKRAGEIKASGAKGEAEFLEGVRRMYGANRLSAAAKAAAPKAAPKMDRGPATRVSKMADRGPAVRTAAKKAVADRGPAVRKITKKAVANPTAKKSGTTDPFAKAVFGVGRAVGRVLSGQEAADRLKKAKAAEAARKAAANKK